MPFVTADIHFIKKKKNIEYPLQVFMKEVTIWLAGCGEGIVGDEKPCRLMTGCENVLVQMYYNNFNNPTFATNMTLL